MLVIKNELWGINDISSQLLKITSKKWSIKGEYFLLQESCVRKICLNDDYVFHNAQKGEYQNINISCGQPDHNVGISQSKMVVEEEKTNMNHPC